MSKHILVTGGAGFIGSHLSEALLARGYRVTVIDNEATGNPADVPEDAKYIKADVRNAEGLTTIFAEGQFDAVMHIAGQASIRKSFMNPLDDLDVNTVGTINILQQCTAHRVPRLLFASSMTLYGTPSQVPTPEDHAPAPVSYYGVTKYAAERYVHLTAERKDLEFDFNVTSFRMFNVYGPRQSLTNAYQGVLAIFMGNVLRGEGITIHSDGEQARDFVYIHDVTRIWCDALDNVNAYGEVFNVGSGKPTTMNHLCDQVLVNFGHTRETYDVRHTPAQPGDIRMSQADIRKARELLGWEPQMSFEEGMAEAIQWARTQYE